MIIWILFGLLLLFCSVALIGAPYLPTHKSSLDSLFDETLSLSPDDLLIDIGSGDGVVLRAAAKRGARAVGYEINPALVVIAKITCWRYGARTKVVLANFWQAKFPDDTTIVYTFGESRDIQRMFDKVQLESNRLQKPLRFVSYGFTVTGQTPVLQRTAMSVYQIQPLQSV